VVFVCVEKINGDNDHLTAIEGGRRRSFHQGREQEGSFVVSKCGDPNVLVIA
jgi:hypothetical protein